MVLTYSTVRICRIEVAVESVSHQFYTIREIVRLGSAGKDLLPNMGLHFGHRLEVDDLIMLFEELVFYKSEQDFVFPALTSVAMFLDSKAFLEVFESVEIEFQHSSIGFCVGLKRKKEESIVVIPSSSDVILALKATDQERSQS